MFERFSEGAREVVQQAADEAATLGHPRIDPEHLLLGVSAGGSGPAADVLARLGLDAPAVRAHLAGGPGDRDALATLGIDLDAVTARAEAAFGPGALAPGGGRRPRFARESKRALEQALREALRRGDREIGAAHVLVGVTRVEDAGLERLLASRGQTPDTLRAATLAALDGG